MPLTPEEQKARQHLIYGNMTAEEVLEDYRDQSKLSGKDMFLAGVLSDVQHVLEHGDKETARVLINRVKLAIFDLEETENDVFLRNRRKQA